MATADSLLREYLSRKLVDWRELSATSHGTATTIIDTKLARYAENDDAFPRWYALFTENTNDGESRISKLTGGYTNSATRLTVADGYSNSTVSGDTYELHRYDPDALRHVVNRAGQTLFPHIFLPIKDKTVAIDQLLLNGAMETFSGGFTNWTAVGSPTVTAETTRFIHGTQSAKVVASGADGILTQNIFTTANLHEIAGRTIYVEGWVWASVNERARIRITFDGSAYTNTPWNSGKGQWQGPDQIKLNVEVPDDATEMSIVLQTVDGATAYFDAILARINPRYNYTIPTTFREGPHWVEIQRDANNPNGTYSQLEEDEIPTPGRWLQLTGRGYLETTTADTDTISVGGSQVDLLITQAAAMFAEEMSNDPTSDEQDFWNTQRLQFEREVAILEVKRKAATTLTGAGKPHGWHVDPSGEARLLVFDRHRG